MSVFYPSVFQQSVFRPKGVFNGDVFIPRPAFEWDFTKGNLPKNLTFTRASNASLWSESALLTTVGASWTTGDNGFVTTWYDQSGNGRNATQTDPTFQPQIISNGALITENGRAYINFAGNKGLGSNHNTSLAFTAAVLKSDTSVFSQYHAIFDSATGGRRGGIVEINQTYFHNSVFPTAVWKNGTALASPFNLAPITTPFQVSIQNTGGAVLNGRIGNFDNLPIGGAAKQSETIVFSAVPSTADRQTLEANQGYYYGISLNPSSGLALDQIGVSAAAAYSLRKLRAGYTGSAIRVRRSSDNAELDIGFTASGELDINALLRFFGAGNDVARLDFNPATARTNWVRNSEFVGGTPGIIGSGGVFPTGWSVSSGSGGGLTTEFHGTGTELGMTYAEFTISGTPTQITYQLGCPSVATTAGTNYVVSGRLRDIGARTNINATRVRCQDGSPGFSTKTTNIDGTQSTPEFAQATRALGAGATTSQARFEIALTIGNAVNYRFRIYTLQHEIGVSVATAYIATTGTARAVSDPRGLLIEGTRTNVALWARDLTQTPWVKTDMTAALTQTGIDGATNSASLLTATAANATVLQTVTLASSQRSQSAFVRRVTGTGTVEMTTDNGTTWTPITLTGSWTRFDLPPQTVTDPVFGFRIVTSGDAIAVDYVQNETGPFASSPILTTTAATTRADDIGLLNTLASIGFNGNVGTLYVEFEFMAPNTSPQTVINIDNNGSTEIQMRRGNANPSEWVPIYFISGTSQTGINVTPPITNNVIYKSAFAWQQNNFAASINGSLTTDNLGNTVNTHTVMRLGRNRTGGAMFGWIRRIVYYPTRLSNTQIQALTA